jgi:putative ABC transport system permease protein
MFRRSPGFALFCVLILGLGIGAVVSVFGVANALLYQPLPHPHGDQIVRVMNRIPKLGLRNNVSGPNWQDWHDQSNAFAALATYRGGEMALTVNGRGTFAEMYWVSREFLDVFETEPAMGRRMDENSVLISHGFWQQQYGGSPGVIGEKVKINERVYTVAGVMGEKFQFPARAAVWIGDDEKPATQNRTANNFKAVGRLKVPLEAAQAEMDALMDRMRAKYPGEIGGNGVGLAGLKDQLAAPYRDTLWLLFGAAVVLLGIACANVSSVMLARAQARVKEFAVRVSLGASAKHIVWQVVAESLALGAASALVGVMLADWGLQAFRGIVVATMDWRVVLFATVVAVGASVLFSVYPAWRVSRVDPTVALGGAGQKGTVGGGGVWFRRSLAAGQVAMALVLLVGTLLLVRSMNALLDVNLGFDPDKVMVSYTHVPAKELDGHLKATATFREVLRQLREAPEVDKAAAVMGMPMGRYGSDGGYMIAGQPMPKDLNLLPQAGFRIVSPGFFETMRVPLKAGRDFTEDDGYDKQFVAIINETLARRSFPNGDALGKQILCGLDSPKPMTVVGIVGDVRHNGPSKEMEAELYMPYGQHPFFANELQIAVRAKGDPRPVSTTVREVVGRMNPDAAVNSVALESMLDESLASEQLRLKLLWPVAGLALVLAAAGLYGVLSYLVNQRMAEFGLRVALGASRGDIVKLVWREAAVIVVAGFSVGLGLVAVLASSVEKFLFGVKALDAMSVGMAVGALLVATAAAVLVPTRGATTADPLEVLRS